MEYYERIAEYDRTGIPTIREGQNLPCNFKVSQSGNGSIALICDIKQDSMVPGNYPCNAIVFNGETSDGWKISTNGDLIGSGFRFGSEYEYLQVEFGVRSLSVVISGDENPERICFGLTNLEFFGTEVEEIKTPTGATLSRSSMKLDLLNEEVWIRRVPNYKEIINYINSSKESRVTAELSIMLSEDDLDKKKKMVNDLCYLMSIIRGTKIVWIYYNLYVNNRIVSRVHLHGITKRYNGGLPLLKDHWDAGNVVKSFLGSAYSTYLTRCTRYRLNAGVIDAYLDAKAEGDFLETRGAKLAVAMEKLKSMFIDNEESELREYIIDKSKFKDYRKDIEKHLRVYFKGRGIKKVREGNSMRI